MQLPLTLNQRVEGSSPSRSNRNAVSWVPRGVAMPAATSLLWQAYPTWRPTVFFQSPYVGLLVGDFQGRDGCYRLGPLCVIQVHVVAPGDVYGRVAHQVR